MLALAERSQHRGLYPGMAEEIKVDYHMKYIAYGSNMVAEQMAHRCPNAQLIGTGWLLNHRLEFYLHATVEKTRLKGARVPVAVWEIDEADERNLDRYEGVPTYYIKRKATVQMRDGLEIEGLIYIMKAIRPHPPEKAYYNGIFHAYNRLGFGSEIETALEPALQCSFRRGIESRFDSSLPYPCCAYTG